MPRSSRFALTVATMLVMLPGARADPLNDARVRVTALAGDVRIAPDQVELVVRADVLERLAAAFGSQTFVANVQSARVHGQIVSGRRTYVELRGDPAVVGRVSASQFAGRWESGPHRLIVTARAEASATAHLKLMIAGIGSRPDVSASTHADARLSLALRDTPSAWLAGNLALESPDRVKVDLNAPLGQIPAKIDLPTTKSLAAFRLSDVVRLQVQLLEGRTIELAIEPVSSTIRPDGVVAIGRGQVAGAP